MTMKTINEHIEEQQRRLLRLSPSHRARLVREAKSYVNRLPHMADSSGFWRGLSARQVIQAGGK